MANKAKKTIRNLKMISLSGKRAEFASRSDPNDKLTTRTFKLRTDSVREEDRSVEAVIATENPVAVYDWNRGMVDEILRMDGIVLPENGQLPLLDTHDRTSVSHILGSTRDLRIEGDKFIGRNYFAKSEAAVHPWTLAKEGHLTDNSIGYRVLKSVLIDRDQTREIDGKTYRASKERDLRVTTKWQVIENSICPVGADPAAKNRASDEGSVPSINFYRKEYTMNFQEWLEARGLEHDKLTEDQRAVLKVAFENDGQRKTKSKADEIRDEITGGDNGTTPRAPSESQLLEKIRLAENQRIDAIRKLGRQFVGIIPQELVDRCVKDGLNIEETRSVFLDKVRMDKINPATSSGARIQNILDKDTYADAILLRAGMKDAVAYRAGVSGDSDGGEVLARKLEMANKIRTISLYDLCYRALEMEGREIPVDRNEAIRTAFSTASMTTILSNVANKALLKGYNSNTGSWRLWCNIGSASDYKTLTRVRLTDVGDLKDTPSDGEVKMGSAVDEAETFTIARYAKRFGVDEITIKNDDLSALTRVPQGLGNRAAALITKLVYEHLLANGNMADGSALFVSGHANLNTSSALSAVTLSAAIAGFRAQTDKDGQPIDIEPKILLVPPGLEEIANCLTRSDLMIAVGVGNAAAKAGNMNVWRGKLQPVVEPRLANANYSGYSATSWYLTGDPSVCDTIEVAFLDGVQVPVLERFDAGAERFGIIWRVRMDAGCKALDYRTMCLNQA